VKGTDVENLLHQRLRKKTGGAWLVRHALVTMEKDRYDNKVEQL
jgi:hypothetical protein